MATAATTATAATPPTVPPTMAPVLEEDTEWIKQVIGWSPLLTYNISPHHSVIIDTKEQRYMYIVPCSTQVTSSQFYTDKSIQIIDRKEQRYMYSV